MASTLPFRVSFFALALALAAASSHALQLGENEAQINARHGAPAVEDHSRHLAVYYWEGWSAQLIFKDGVVGKLTYRRNTYLEGGEIQSLLQANGGVVRWRETTSLGTQVRQWIRDDGAVALTDAARPTGMIFQGGRSTAESIVPDSFLKFDAPAVAPALQPVTAVPRSEPLVRSNAQQLLRAEPQLRPDESLSEVFAPAPEAPAAPAVESEKPGEVPAAVATVEPVASESRGSSGGVVGAILGGIAGVGLIAAALFYFLAKRQPVRAAHFAAPATPPPMPAAPPAAESDALDLESLRADQIELLLGEIFRRQGYTVELSAALGADGRSDLTLRRDGESIPVQSSDWKTARVTEREVREFYGVMAATAAPRGVIVTTGGFSREARDLAGEKSIELIDRTVLAQRIAAVRRPDENIFDVPSWIDDFTAYARIFDPECPCCTQAMVIRHNRVGGEAYWGCTTYPRCAGKRETRRDLPLPAAA